jgi:hypothetical protein
MAVPLFAISPRRENSSLLGEGEELLRRGAVGHNHFWFYRDAIEAMLAAGDAAGALRYAASLEDYTRGEKLPWSDLFIARGRALAGALQGRVNDAVQRDIANVRAALLAAELKAFLPPVEAALAA